MKEIAVQPYSADSDVLPFISQVVKAHYRAATRELDEHQEQWHRVAQWLDDDESRLTYRKELIFWALRHLLSPEKAAMYSPLTPETWNAAAQATLKAREKNLLPQLETGMPPDDPHTLYAMVNGYMLDQYAYHAIVRPEPNDVVLDCGGCFGETAIWSRLNGAGTVYSFEPNPASISHMRQNARRYDPGEEWFVPVPLGLSNQVGMVPFMQRADHPGACAFDDKGNIQVPVTTIDQWCEQNRVIPDFIKMDLEGAEPLAIQGAEKTFRAYRPRFAICLYHELPHMWELPTLLKSYVPEYRLWCKKSSPVGEFVLFGKAD